jgi:fructose-specific phosphotransferase system component IIB
VIDFRYHVVSLISVFVALAIGIALGAGPLEQSIGDTLTGQVDQLREDRDALREQLDDVTAELERGEQALAAVAPTLLEGVLPERSIAVVELAEVQPEVRDEVTARLIQAGATVTASVRVTDQWTDPERRSFRQSLAGTLVDFLDPVPAEDAGADVELAEALVQALAARSAEDPTARSDNADILLELLSGEAGLITVDGEVGAPADAVVVLAGPTVDLAEAEATEAEVEGAAETPEEAAAETELHEARVAAARAIALAADRRTEGAVVASGALTETGVVNVLRQDEELLASVPTVESVHAVSGQVGVPMALSAGIAGTVGHYGPSAGATAAMPPRVQLPPVLPVDPAGEVATDGTTEGAEEGPDGATEEAPPTDAPAGDG